MTDLKIPICFSICFSKVTSFYLCNSCGQARNLVFFMNSRNFNKCVRQKKKRRKLTSSEVNNVLLRKGRQDVFYPDRNPEPGRWEPAMGPTGSSEEGTWVPTYQCQLPYPGLSSELLSTILQEKLWFFILSEKFLLITLVNYIMTSDLIAL